MYKCNQCNITIPDNQAEGRIVKVGPKDNPKFYCMECGEPVVYIPDMPHATGAVHGAQATLISNSDNRITTNNYYGGGVPDEQIDTPYGSCRKSEARLCKKCRQWVPVSFFDEEKKLCDDCVTKEVQKYVNEGKSYFDMGFYNEAIRCFQDCELICYDENELLNLKFLIGQSYYELKDYSQALKYFIAASRNNAESVYYIGICYLNGTGVVKDESKALNLFARSADLGSQKAIAFLKERQRLKDLETLELHPIEENGKYGFADENGNVVIPCKWISVSIFDEGLALVRDDDKKWGFIDKTGGMVIPCKWIYASIFNEGLALVRDDNYKYGFIDKTGGMVIPCKWTSAGGFHEGLALVRDDNEKYGFIDKTGNVIIPCKWKDASFFSEGLASVQDEDGSWVYINKRGEKNNS